MTEPALRRDVGSKGAMASQRELDQLDREIVDLLEIDGRRSLASIGKQVGLSTSAVKRRVDRLESSGVIAGYTAIINQQRMGNTMEAVTELRFSGSADITEIRAFLAGIPEAQATFVTAGDPDAILWLKVDGPAGLQHAVEKLRRAERVVGTKTLLVLESRSRERTAFPRTANPKRA